MKLTIEGDTLIDVEEKIIDLADEIVERRALLKDGCTCDLRLPDTLTIATGDYKATVQQRCCTALAVCETRRGGLRQGGARSTAKTVSD